MNNSTIKNRFFEIERRQLLSLLWLFILLNMIFRDIHEFIKADMIEQILSGTIHGFTVSEGLLLIGGIVVVITTAMVVLSASLRRKPNRILNFIFAPLMALSIVSNGYQDMDDMLHMGVEFIATLLIISIACRWRQDR